MRHLLVRKVKEVRLYLSASLFSLTRNGTAALA